MAEHSEWKLLSENDIQCDICHELAKEPKLLNCLHFFCKQCIEVSVCSAPNQTFSCPTCNEKIVVRDNDVDQIPTLYLIDKITQVGMMSSQAKKQCIQCG